jgi:hypothetical protein
MLLPKILLDTTAPQQYQLSSMTTNTILHQQQSNGDSQYHHQIKITNKHRNTDAYAGHEPVCAVLTSSNWCHQSQKANTATVQHECNSNVNTK